MSVVTGPRLAFVVGTSGELIKLSPLLIKATQRRWSWRVFSTGQSAINLVKQWREFKLPEENFFRMLSTTDDLNNSVQALSWFLKAYALNRRALAEQFSDFDCVVVHGDTLSTLIGSLWAKRLKLPLAHVEAGLRSTSVWEPFPEEINRRWVSRKADIHFAPNPWAVENLKRSGTRGRIVETRGNTMAEALHLVLAQNPPVDLPKEKFVLANIHRFENLKSEPHWKMIKKALFLAARSHPVYMVVHPSTGLKLRGEEVEFERAGVRLIARKAFHEFAHWLQAAEFLLTDGGSNQEECSYLGVPCLVLRLYTERTEGLDENVLLSRLDSDKITEFLESPQSYRRSPLQKDSESTQIILDSLSESLS